MKFFMAVLLACSPGMPKANAQHDVKVGGSSAVAIEVFEFDVFAIDEVHFGGTYEYVIRKNMGVLISGTYIQSYHLNFDYSGFRIMPQFRYYFWPGDHNATGFFAGVFLCYRNTKGSVIVSSPTFFLPPRTTGFVFEETTNSAGIGISTGYKFAFDSGFVFEVLAGYGRYLMYKSSILTDRSDATDGIYDIGDRVSGTLALNNFRFAFNIGWRFGGAFRNKKNENR